MRTFASIQRFGVVAILFVALGAAAQQGPGQPLQIAVSSTNVRVANVTNGGALVLFAATLANDSGLIRQRGVATIVADIDRDGIVEYVDPRAIPFRSVWVAVDVETGRFAIGAPPNFDLNVVPFPSSHLRDDADGTIGVFDLSQVSGTLLVVRPKKGAWSVLAAEGGSADADHLQNGKLALAAEDTTAIGGSGPPPKRLKKGDIIAVIDPHRLDVSITELEK